MGGKPSLATLWCAWRGQSCPVPHVITTAIAGLVGGLLAPVMAAAQPDPLPLSPWPEPTNLSSALPGPHAGKALTAEDLESFLDGLVPAALARDDIAGAVVCVVKDGNVLFAKGYGYADVAARIPVSPEATLFRVGSIAKLFVWTAVMQLVEQGKLDLDRDVSTYVDVAIPATFAQPITMRHLMTHQAGFEDVVFPYSAATLADLPTRGNYLRTHQPQRIFAPGSTFAYSNYGAELAAYVVERVSSELFEQYVMEHIFSPLVMTHSSFQQPLPPALAPLLSQGYSVASGAPKVFELMMDSAAGALTTSALDLAHFMIAHLQEGRFGGHDILRPETAQQMYARQVGVHPDLNGMALGFVEVSRKGHRVIAHSGGTAYFYSLLFLVPEAEVGLFVAFNSTGRDGVAPVDLSLLFEAFMDRYFSGGSPLPAPAPTAVADARTVTGRYVTTRRVESMFLRALSLVPPSQVSVQAKADGTITVDGFTSYNGQPMRWREIGPLVYQEEGGRDLRLAFTGDGAGRIVGFSPGAPVEFQRVSWADSWATNLPVIGITTLLLLATVMLWPIAALVRRVYRAPLPLDVSSRWLHVAVRGVCLVDLLFLGSLIGSILLAFADPSLFLYGDGSLAWLHGLQVIGGMGVLGTALAMWHAARLWRRRDLGRWLRLHAVLLAVACLGFSWFVLHWNLLRVATDAPSG